MSFFLPVYLAAIVLTGLTIGLALSLAVKSGQRLHQVFLFFVIVNDLAGLFDILFRFFPARHGSTFGGVAPVLLGFLTFPLMAAFSYLVVDWLFALGSVTFPKILKTIFAAYWGLLFIGFLAAEFRHIVYQDLRLANLLQPFFNAAIILSGMGAAIFIFMRSRSVADPRERRFVSRVCAYTAVSFIVFIALFFLPLPIEWKGRILIRSFMGMLYLLPPLVWMNGRFRETRKAFLTRLAGEAEGLGRWLKAKMLSPREQQIAFGVLEGKSNSAIGKELYIGLRTVESHLYSIYRKLGVKNRLQLARLAAAELEQRDPS